MNLSLKFNSKFYQGIISFSYWSMVHWDYY